MGNTTYFDLSGTGSVNVTWHYGRDGKVYLDTEVEDIDFNVYNDYEDVDIAKDNVIDEFEGIDYDVQKYLDKHNIDITKYDSAVFDFTFRMSGKIWEWEGTYWEPPEYDIDFKDYWVDLDLVELVEFDEDE